MAVEGGKIEIQTIAEPVLDGAPIVEDASDDDEPVVVEEEESPSDDNEEASPERELTEEEKLAIKKLKNKKRKQRRLEKKRAEREANRPEPTEEEKAEIERRIKEQDAIAQEKIKEQRREELKEKIRSLQDQRGRTERRNQDGTRMSKKDMHKLQKKMRGEGIDKMMEEWGITDLLMKSKIKSMIAAGALKSSNDVNDYITDMLKSSRGANIDFAEGSAGARIRNAMAKGGKLGGMESFNPRAAVASSSAAAADTNPAVARAQALINAGYDDSGKLVSLASSGADALPMFDAIPDEK